MKPTRFLSKWKPTKQTQNPQNQTPKTQNQNPPNQTLSDIPLRKQQIITNLKQFHHEGIYCKTFKTLFLNEHNFSVAASVGREIGGWSNMIATTSRSTQASKEVKTDNIHNLVAEIQGGKDKCWYDINPLFMEEPNNLQWLKFHRIVILNPSTFNLCPEKLGDFFDKVPAYFAEDDDVASELHLFCTKKYPILKWDLERLAMNHGLVCEAENRFPWGGRKGKNDCFIVTFQRKKTPEQELLEEDEEDKEKKKK